MLCLFVCVYVCLCVSVYSISGCLFSCVLLSVSVKQVTPLSLLPSLLTSSPRPLVLGRWWSSILPSQSAGTHIFGPGTSRSDIRPILAKSGSGHDLGQIWIWTNVSTVAVSVHVDCLQLKLMKLILSDLTSNLKIWSPLSTFLSLFSVLSRCWLGDRKNVWL